MFRLITINFYQKSTHFSLLSSTSPGELSVTEREVTSPSTCSERSESPEIQILTAINFWSFLDEHLIWTLKMEKNVNI
jgi:hypothetical protein